MAGEGEMAGSENGSVGGSISRKQKRWIPVSLRPPFLFTVAAFFLLMALSIEFLRQYSNRHHGLIHLKSYEQLGSHTSGVYTYVPTAFAVLAVALWNICALDILRLETWFQLAQPAGAPGTVLFTNYCFYYGALTPIMAARNRHWIVLCVSSIGLVLRVMLPSLMSGLVYLDEPIIVSTRHIDTWPSVVNLETQSAWLESAAYLSKDRTDTLVDTFFFYQTPDYSIPPTSRPVSRGSGGSTWALTQDVYWAELNCMKTQSIDISPSIWTDPTSAEKALTWNVREDKFLNADSNCRVEITFNSTSPTENKISQIRHWEPLDPNGNGFTSTLNSTGCNSFSLIGLIIDVDATSKTLASKATVFGCASSYLRAKAAITLPANSSVVDVTSVSNTTATLASTDLSISKFQNLLFAKYLQDDLSLWDNGRLISSTGATGVNGTLIPSDTHRISVAQYERDVSSLWNRHFVASFNNFFDTTIDPARLNVTLNTATIVYSVIGHSALVAEALLFSAFILLIVVSFFYPRRPNFLQSDPGSIAAQCALITDKLSSLHQLTPSGLDYTRATPRQLRRFARTLWCKWTNGPSGNRLDITSREGHVLSPSSETSRKRRKIRPISRPHFLTPPWFAVEFLLMAGVLGAFGVSFQFIRVDKFDTSDSNGTLAVAYFLVYGPTVIASMISSLFVSIHRHIGYMEPWIQLKKGMALATDSLTVNYCSHTPLTVWKLFREKRPPLLVMLSIVCMLDYVLTIVSSGMFEPSVEYWTEHTNAFAVQYNGSRFFSPEVRAQFTGNSLISDSLVTGKSLLSWTTPSLSFYPLGINDPDAEWTDWTMYTARTRGVGAELQCEELDSSQPRYDNASGSSYWDYTTPAGTNCTAELPSQIEHGQSVNATLHFGASLNSSIACERSFLVGLFGHLNSTNITDKALATANLGVFHCSPKVIIEDFEVRFNPDGMVHSSTPIPKTSITSGPMFQNVSNSLVPFSQAFMRQTQANTTWAGLVTTQVYDMLISDPTSHHHSWSHPHSEFHSKAQHAYSHRNETRKQALVHTLQDVYQATFSTYTTLQRDLYLSPLDQNANKTIVGTISAAVWEIYPSNTTIVIIIILLSLDLCVLVAVFWLRHDQYAGPPIPRSVGSLVPWIANSSMLNDIRDTAEWTEDERKKHLQLLGHRYRYGEWDREGGRVALDHDEKPMTENEYEMNEWQLPRSDQIEDTQTSG
ncbi:uncharacterized protein N7484_001632 [Penicillium longicatenatum]|uniref:uncharacterized protein n=1 Tax=Penicillium longicatenatum TaxID=1561947 RepID=UPI002547E550|nr:uncharacterized protein N7484_001632 [Penicillium longicatenatum]KAJ5657983.1 hypothetical protein N7484_001632 [Penicillium longicatenatum]